MLFTLLVTHQFGSCPMLLIVSGTERSYSLSLSLCLCHICSGRAIFCVILIWSLLAYLDGVYQIKSMVCFPAYVKLFVHDLRLVVTQCVVCLPSLVETWNWANCSKPVSKHVVGRLSHKLILQTQLFNGLDSLLLIELVESNLSLELAHAPKLRRVDCWEYGWLVLLVASCRGLRRCALLIVNQRVFAWALLSVSSFDYSLLGSCISKLLFQLVALQLLPISQLISIVRNRSPWLATRSMRGLVLIDTLCPQICKLQLGYFSDQTIARS